MRILCFAYRKLSAKEYNMWKIKLDQATSIKRRTERIKAIEQVYDEIEANLSFLGVAAFTDILQDNVYQVIADLKKAEIKVWMVTGDKKELAENIGKNTRIINPKSFIYSVESIDSSELKLNKKE